LSLSSIPQEPPPRHWDVEHVEQLAEIAVAAVRLAKENFNIDFDYSPASLKALDEALGSREYFEEAELDEESEEAIITMLGAYLGEVVRRNLDGRWELSDELPSPRIVGLKSVEWLDPMARIAKRSQEGESASLWKWYRSVQRHSTG
jgi:hypothetical protein